MQRTDKTQDKQIRKNCRREYEMYHSANYASRVLGYNERTVETYYKEFYRQEPEETNLGFVQRQRSVRNRVLSRMDWVLDKLEEQLDRISRQLRKDDDAVDKPKYEALMTKVLKTISDILQQKASIEITPTLDISLEKYINEKYGISKRTNHP